MATPHDSTWPTGSTPASRWGDGSLETREREAWEARYKHAKAATYATRLAVEKHFRHLHARGRTRLGRHARRWQRMA